jgi:hypothetical protein
MHEDVGRCVGTATSGLVQPEHLQTTRNREKENRRREELWPSAECRFRRTLVVMDLVFLPLLSMWTDEIQGALR